MTLIHFTQPVQASYDVTLSRSELIALLVEHEVETRDELKLLHDNALVLVAVHALNVPGSALYDEFASQAPDISLDGADVDDWQFSQFID